MEFSCGLPIVNWPPVRDELTSSVKVSETLIMVPFYTRLIFCRYNMLSNGEGHTKMI